MPILTDEDIEKRKTYHRLWRQRNKEKIAAYEAKRKTTKNKRTREWHAANPDYKREWMRKNRGRSRYHTAKRRAIMEKATPKWLTIEHHRIMVHYYLEAERLSEEKGVPHHVDHVIPINGVNVCGLHVPNNLQILTAEANRIKGNSYVG